MIALGSQLLASFLFCASKALKIGGYMNYLAGACYIVVVIVIGAAYMDEVNDGFSAVFTLANGGITVDADVGLAWVGSAPPGAAAPCPHACTPAPRRPRT